MAKRIAASTLNATTLDILNVIRQNASYDYQQNVPAVTKVTDIPRVGEIICGTHAFANQFINSLVNRIALVSIQSATFNNPYAMLKKGYLEFGETVEDIFVSIANVVDYNPEKAEAREFKRTIPDVRSVFHVMNWRTMYPITIQDEDLKQAFLNANGIQSLVAKMVDSMKTAAEYDEFLLFKYLLIKAISHGKMKPADVGTGDDIKESGVKFRGISNTLPFMSSQYNESGVKTTTPKERQVIFMDSMFNAKYDVNVLASAFNMDKADFMGRLFLIDNWTEFDNERFDVIRANSDGIEAVTSAELELLKDVHAVILDENWFQVYDNKNKMTENYISSGMYWNYFYHTWKTVSYSPFANAVVFVTSNANTELPTTLTCEILSKDTSEEAIVFTISADADGATLEPNSVHFVQTQEATTNGIGIQKYGAVIIPASKFNTKFTLEAEVNGTKYKAATTISSSQNVGATVTLNKQG